MKLAKANIAKIEADFATSGKSDQIVFDEELSGFGIRLRKGSKRRVWVLQYMRNGMQRRLTLGTTEIYSPDEARSIAKRELGKVWQGEDPAADKQAARDKARITLGAVIETFLEAKARQRNKRGELTRPRTLGELQRYLRKDWKPLHKWAIHKIDRRQVSAVLDEIEKNGQVTAARARNALSSLMRWAMGKGYVDQNVVIGTNNPDTHAERDRALDDAELAAVWRASGDSTFGTIVKLLVLTGARRNEVAGMRWSELDQDKHIWTLPKERAKNGRELELPLPGAFWQIIETVPQRPVVDCLFSRSADGFQNWASKKALDERCKIPKHWVIHDLRRSVATGMANIGIQPHIIEAILNHYSGHRGGTAGTYNRSPYAREVRNALAAWADHVRQITTGVAPTVVPLRGVS